MGPLKGLRVVEIGGLAPGPFCAQLLADMGADVIRIDRKEQGVIDHEPKYEVLLRGRPTVRMDIKKPGAIDTVLQLIDHADALIEGFRPGVMEDLGLGPETCLERNARLIYGRVTGWGQEGPLAKAAGHDINYIALSGVLHAIGPEGGKPVPPLNLIGDFGGGGLLLAFGIMCGLFELQKSGRGQVVDAAMIDGSAAQMGMMFGMHASGLFSDQRGRNIIDGGTHFYNTYETADGKWISVGSMEPQFYALLLEYTGIDDPDFHPQYDPEKWPICREKMAAVIKTKTREEWCRIMEGSDACFAPVLNYQEAFEHPHNRARGTLVEIEGVVQPAPSPRFSRTQPDIPAPPQMDRDISLQALRNWGIEPARIEMLIRNQAL